MAKKIRALVKVQAPAGKATPAPPIGPALGQHGINIMAFVKEFNERTATQTGMIVPAEITVFEDRSFTFITKTPPASDLLQERGGGGEGLGRPQPGEGGHRVPGQGAGHRRAEDAGPQRQRPRRGRASMIEGTARSMGIDVVA